MKLINKVLFFVCFCLLMFSGDRIFADDAPVLLTSGGAQALDSTAVMKIQMVSETVNIIMGKNAYIIDANFEFKNDGDTISVGVGFPKNGEGYLDDRFKHTANFIKFETWVNDVSTPFVEKANTSRIESYVTLPELMSAIRKTKPDKHPQIITFAIDKRWMVKRVQFKGNAITKTRVRYEAPYLNGSPCKGCASYIYGTGKYWIGNIGKATFIVDLTGIPKNERPPSRDIFTFTNTMDEKRAKRRSLRDGVEEIVIQDFKPNNEEDRIFVCYGCPYWQ